MKRLYIFLTGVGVSAAVLLGSLVFSSYFFEDFWRPACMVPGMGEMMRRGGVESGGPRLLMYLPAVALTALVFTVAGALYYALFPELQVHEVETRLKAGGDILMVLREDERMIVETLVKHGGTYLQKDIRRETGMTRLKVHRAVARLAERGVVSVKRHGNTNRVELTPWLREKLKQR